MQKPRVLSKADETKLWDAITTHDCHSTDDVASHTGWTRWRAGSAIKAQRRAASEGRSWWTVAHVTRKAGGMPFRAVDAQTGQSLSDRDQRGIMLGELENLRSVRQATLNGAAVFKFLGAQVAGISAALGKRCVQQSRLMETSGDMAERVMDDLEALLAGR